MAHVKEWEWSGHVGVLNWTAAAKRPTGRPQQMDSDLKEPTEMTDPGPKQKIFEGQAEGLHPTIGGLKLESNKKMYLDLIYLFNLHALISSK